MSAIDASMEPMLEMFIYESTTLLEQLDNIILEAEKDKSFSEEQVGEIFRIMHTIKGSSSMMGLDAVSHIAHSVEDMFFIIRDDNSKQQRSANIFDLVLQCTDYLKAEVENAEVGYEATPSDELAAAIRNEISVLKGEAPASAGAGGAAGGEEAAGSGVASLPDSKWLKIVFEEGAQMEHIRSFNIIKQVSEAAEQIQTIPDHPEKNPDCSEEIVNNGLLINFAPKEAEAEIESIVSQALNLSSFEFFDECPSGAGAAPAPEAPKAEEPKKEEPKQEEPKAEVAKPVETAPSAPSAPAAKKESAPGGGKQSLISVKQDKLDQLMDVVSELVISESMVASNPDLKGLQLDNFNKAMRDLRKLTDELQDISMSMRMVTLQSLFQKMNRIVRDMSKKLGKQVELVTVGEDTEIDKTINDLIQDPFMHMVRNSVDHAIEMPDERIAAGKDPTGKVTLSAQNVGGEIVIGIADDGTGLDADAIMEKAKSRGLLTKPESEYTLKEIHSMIMMPGFSTNTVVTEFSGRGVGMDVVKKNIEQCNGTLSIESEKGKGTTFWIKIPLTLAIIDTLQFYVGDTIFALPITSIQQSFKISEDTKVFLDTDGSEMIMVRNECYPIIRLHEKYNIESKYTDLPDGIMILVENGENKVVVFADHLIGEQQIVLKPFPKFLARYGIKQSGLSGCTILGDGSISLILDANGLTHVE